MPGRWFRLPTTPLGWLLTLAILMAAGLALVPRQFDAEGSGGTRTPSIHAMPDPDDDEDDWIVPPRQEFAI